MKPKHQTSFSYLYTCLTFAAVKNILKYIDMTYLQHKLKVDNLPNTLTSEASRQAVVIY